jgi:glutamate N-acetyltransferase/amino-acid N-acetyltransferase
LGGGAAKPWTALTGRPLPQLGRGDDQAGRQGVADGFRVPGQEQRSETDAQQDEIPSAADADGAQAAAARLSRDSAEGVRAANAILTSDTRPKTCTARFAWQGQTVTIAGFAKGAGMIEPNMATMLAFVCTDADGPDGSPDDHARRRACAPSDARQVSTPGSSNSPTGLNEESIRMVASL